MFKRYKALKLYYKQLKQLKFNKEDKMLRNVDKDKVEKFIQDRNKDLSSGLGAIVRMLLELGLPFSHIYFDSRTPLNIRVAYCMSNICKVLSVTMLLAYGFFGALTFNLLFLLVMAGIFGIGSLLGVLQVNFNLKGHINDKGEYEPDFTKDRR